VGFERCAPQRLMEVSRLLHLVAELKHRVAVLEEKERRLNGEKQERFRCEKPSSVRGAISNLLLQLLLHHKPTDMPSLFSRFKDLLLGKSVQSPDTQKTPVEQQNPSSSNSTYYRIKFLIERLNYVHQDPTYQSEIRKKAYLDLQEFGIEAQSAIPELIIKQMSDNVDERDFARQTIELIDPKWQECEYAQSAVPMLIKRLGSEYRASLLSMQILHTMGIHAHKPLIQYLSDQTSTRDQYADANILWVLSKTNAPWQEIYPAINKILEASETANTLEAATKAIALLGEENLDTATQLVQKLRHTDRSVRRNAVQALKKVVAEAEQFIPAILHLLSDDDDQVRQAAVDFLSHHYSNMVDDFVHEVVHKRGEMDEKDWQEVLERVNFWIGSNTLRPYEFNYSQLVNNLSWYNLDLLKVQTKSNRLLESAISILYQNGRPVPEITDVLKEIYTNNLSANVQKMIVAIVGRVESAWESDVLPFLLNCLKNKEASVRAEAVKSLQNHSAHWIEHPAAIAAVQSVIDELDTARCDSAKSTLLSLGHDAVPTLLSQLEQTEKRLIQQNILEILGQMNPDRALTLDTLTKISEHSQNTHTLAMIKELIKKMQG